MKVGTDGVILGAWVNCNGANRILDIGTGTGLLALMMAQRTSAFIDGIDIDEAACKQAEENMQASKWKTRLNIACTPLQEYKPRDQFDLIISNPPYFLHALAPTDEARSRARLATDTLTYEDLIENTLRFMCSKGKLNVILPYNEGKIFREKAMQSGLFNTRITAVYSREHKPIKRLLMEFSRLEAPTEEKIFILHGEGREYSEEYKKLTADFFPKFMQEDAAP